MPLSKRYEFTLFYDVQNGNPNGDPDAGNLPRIDPETGHGLVTDVCLKRKVRNYVEIVKAGAPGYQIYVTEGAILNEKHRLAYKAVRNDSNVETAKELNPANKNEAAELTRWMCANFYDVRAFGAVMSTGINCGQVRGPVQFTFSRSADPIVAHEVTITRVAVTREGESKDREMGRKHIVPYALYRMNGYVSALLSEQTGFSEEDLELLWEALTHLFEHDRSASRGQMTVRKLIIFEHSTALGNAPAHVLFESIGVERLADRPPRDFSDYRIHLDRGRIPPEVRVIER
ncbi:MAG: type I-C CRISPR-associated protein Cas7/Csd2 [Candidatus Reconcilbacillus cellulovorans]|uniref:Type I-C CRISPR-associated protein Cas7/Csd2 n=1 Tax=Candidatus Reconcilbacillus cellulovorans TaxID=1906605 RepID=A0A2A6DZQ3_9BACL|nr:MAG: type I-C CRISPR-associated protein Cas7/Csd2 [Candidatus Reconcilbacillus cellulovorans]